VRSAIIRGLPSRNPDDEVFAWIASLTKDPDAGVRGAALESFFMTVEWHRDEVCALFGQHVTDPDQMIGLSAMHGITNKHCAAQYDGFLDEMERRMKRGDQERVPYIALPELLRDGQNATAAQTKRGEADLRALVSDARFGWLVRNGVLEALAREVPKLAKEILPALSTDKDPNVARVAKELLARFARDGGP
jgi:hypothetical protein